MSTATNPKSLFSKEFKESGFVWRSQAKYQTVKLYSPAAGIDLSDDYARIQYERFLDKRSLEDSKPETITPYLKKVLPVVVGTTFLPNGKAITSENGLEWVNEYKAYTPSQHSVTPIPRFLELLERMVPDSAQRHLFISYIAHLFQKPEERPTWHIMLLSEAGTGKGFLVENILTPLLCGQSLTVSSYSRVTGTFQGALGTTMLVLLDDPKSTSDATMTQLKSIMSGGRVYIERKGVDGRMQPFFARFILASNELKPLDLDDDERRWFAPDRLKHRVSKEETQEFIKELAEDLKSPHYLDSVHTYLMTYDISDFNPEHVAQSDQLKEIIGLSGTSHEQDFRDYVQSNNFFNNADLKEHFKAIGLDAPRDKYIRHQLTALGLVTERFRDKSSKQIRCWCKKSNTQADFSAHEQQQPSLYD